MNENETDEVEKQQLLLMKLLNNFENCLERIRSLLNAEQPLEISIYQDDDEEWVDIDREDEVLKKPRSEIYFNNRTYNFPEKINEEIKVDAQNNVVRK